MSSVTSETRAWICDFWIAQMEKKSLACYDTTLQPQALGEAVSAVREQLKATIKGEQRDRQQIDGYEWKINGSDAMLAAWLPSLADVGRNLYRALLPESQRKSSDDQGEKLKAALQSGAAIQINPIVGKVTIPWALLYERPVLIMPGETRICEKYSTAGSDCQQCESLTDPTVICPYAFWGYRYLIEQLPCWVGGELPEATGPTASNLEWKTIAPQSKCLAEVWSLAGPY